MPVTLAPIMGRPKKKERTSHLRVYSGTLLKLSIIARVHDLDISDAIEEVFASVIEREYEKALRILEQKRTRHGKDDA